MITSGQKISMWMDVLYAHSGEGSGLRTEKGEKAEMWTGKERYKVDQREICSP
jgi:hypothetical protein